MYWPVLHSPSNGLVILILQITASTWGHCLKGNNHPSHTLEHISTVFQCLRLDITSFSRLGVGKPGITQKLQWVAFQRTAEHQFCLGLLFEGRGRVPPLTVHFPWLEGPLFDTFGTWACSILCKMEQIMHLRLFQLRKTVQREAEVPLLPIP